VLNNDDCSGLPPADSGIMPAIGRRLVDCSSPLVVRRRTEQHRPPSVAALPGKSHLWRVVRERLKARRSQLDL